jgi:hypothetical protein
MTLYEVFMKRQDRNGATSYSARGKNRKEALSDAIRSFKLNPSDIKSVRIDAERNDKIQLFKMNRGSKVFLR